MASTDAPKGRVSCPSTCWSCYCTRRANEHLCGSDWFLIESSAVSGERRRDNHSPKSLTCETLAKGSSPWKKPWLRACSRLYDTHVCMVQFLQLHITNFISWKQVDFLINCKQSVACYIVIIIILSVRASRRISFKAKLIFYTGQVNIYTDQVYICIKQVNIYTLLYGSVSKGLGTTIFTNLIGQHGYWPRSRFSHLYRLCWWEKKSIEVIRKQNVGCHKPVTLNELNCSCFRHIINISLTELSRCVWENLDLGRVYRPHCFRSVLTTSVKILPYRHSALLIRAKTKFIYTLAKLIFTLAKLIAGFQCHAIQNRSK